MKPPRADRPDSITEPIVVPETATLPGPRGYAEFEIDIEEILRRALPGFFANIQAAPLIPEAIKEIPEGAKGAYLLLLDGDVVYAGKTDTRHGFRDRLGRHADSVRHRVGLDPGKMSFKAVRIMVFSAFDVEAILIGELRKANKGALPWNDSGFGSNDPGRRRDGQEPAKFDKWYPIDIDIPIDLPTGELTAAETLERAKRTVPYLLRYEDQPELSRTTVNIPGGSPPTMRSALLAVLEELPPEWQVTLFHGRVIMYRERRHYEYAREVMHGRK